MSEWIELTAEMKARLAMSKDPIEIKAKIEGQEVTLPLRCPKCAPYRLRSATHYRPIKPG